MKVDKDSPYPRIYQAKAPHAVIGGNHVGADMLTQIVIDKYRYHLPEYRQVRQYADLGLKLPHLHAERLGACRGLQTGTCLRGFAR